MQYCNIMSKQRTFNKQIHKNKKDLLSYLSEGLSYQMAGKNLIFNIGFEKRPFYSRKGRF
ncbi:MAG: hypothetical protein RIS29_2011 [Bacteroidota bacterium]|jgi:hypothetical protein